MDTNLLKDIVGLIKSEQLRREAALPEEDEYSSVYAQMGREDLSFVNELYLMLLVSIRHRIEKELLKLAARATNDGADLESKEFAHQLELLLEFKRKRGGTWKEVTLRLELGASRDYDCLEALRHLANCYKHEPYTAPDEKLLNHLGLEKGSYAELSESSKLQKGLAVYLGLDKDSDYSDIANRFVDIADRFLKGVRKSPKISKVKAGRASLAW